MCFLCCCSYLFSSLFCFFFFLCLFCFFFFFFFSSRRRHTRCLSDWSSDVCSSDLRSIPSGTSGFKRPTRLSVGGSASRLKYTFRKSPCGHVESGASVPVRLPSSNGTRAMIAMLRSEERRVGKECGSRVGAEHYMKR